MRDFERLEELSGTVEAGLAANDVIWAVDQAFAGAQLDENAKGALRSGSSALNLMADPTDVKLGRQAPSRRARQSLLPIDVVHSVREVVAGPPDGVEDVSNYLRELASVLDAMAEGEPAERHAQKVDAILRVFSLIGEVELSHANTIVRRRKEPMWLRPTPTSPSS